MNLITIPRPRGPGDRPRWWPTRVTPIWEYVQTYDSYAPQLRSQWCAMCHHPDCGGEQGKIVSVSAVESWAHHVAAVHRAQHRQADEAAKADAGPP